MNLKPLAPIPPVENIKYSPISSQVNINSHTKDLFTSVPTTRYNMSNMSKQKVARHDNRQEKKCLRRQNSRQNSARVCHRCLNYQTRNFKKL